MSKKNKKLKIVAPPAKAAGQGIGRAILITIILTAIACYLILPLLWTVRFRIEADDAIQTGNVEKWVPLPPAAKSAAQNKASILKYDKNGNIEQLRGEGNQ